MNTQAKGIAYYTALGEKNFEAVKECLHPDIQFTDPQETVIGREAVLQSAKGFACIFKALTIRTAFGADEQAMVVYEVEIPGFAKNLQAASLLSFKDGLISKIELFYDTSSFKD